MFKLTLAAQGGERLRIGSTVFIRIETNFTTGMGIGLARLSGSSLLSRSELNSGLRSQILMNYLSSIKKINRHCLATKIFNAVPIPRATPAEPTENPQNSLMAEGRTDRIIHIWAAVIK